ncbi:MAG: hypothetical protein QOI78_4965 [Actinomycetota bacterium]|jgi:hypothetical protein|nr:hypothetical protein [Actinomycetota bacterium]
MTQKIRRLVQRAATAAGAAGVGVLTLIAPAGAAPAVAGDQSATSTLLTTDWQVLTTDSGTRGGIAQWDGPDTFRACDNQADGLRAWAQASWEDSSLGTQYATVDDPNGAGTCTSGHTPSFVKNITIHLKICLRNGSTGTLRYCNVGSGPAF